MPGWTNGFGCPSKDIRKNMGTWWENLSKISAFSRFSRSSSLQMTIAIGPFQETQTASMDLEEHATWNCPKSGMLQRLILRAMPPMVMPLWRAYGPNNQRTESIWCWEGMKSSSATTYKFRRGAPRNWWISWVASPSHESHNAHIAATLQHTSK